MEHNWRIYERDVDVLLAEEFYTNSSFAAWALSRTKAFPKLEASVVEVIVSLNDEYGESDLVIKYQTADGLKVALLVEDKIDAQFQPDQLARYRERGEAGRRISKWAQYQVVLCAPQSFIERQVISKEFDAVLAFEDIADFIRQEQRSLRGEYRAGFLTTAAAHASTSYVKFKDADTDTFWWSAYEMAQRDFPALEMREPNYASGANWIIFRPADMPGNIWTEFKGASGVVDMMFYGTSMEQVRRVAGALVDSNMTIQMVGKSPAIRLRAERFVVSQGFDGAKEALQSGFSAAMKCISFYRKNQSSLSELARTGRKRR